MNHTLPDCRLPSVPATRRCSSWRRGEFTTKDTKDTKRRARRWTLDAGFADAGSPQLLTPCLRLSAVKAHAGRRENWRGRRSLLSPFEAERGGRGKERQETEPRIARITPMCGGLNPCPSEATVVRAGWWRLLTPALSSTEEERESAFAFFAFFAFFVANPFCYGALRVRVHGIQAS